MITGTEEFFNRELKEEEIKKEIKDIPEELKELLEEKKKLMNSLKNSRGSDYYKLLRHRYSVVLEKIRKYE